MNSPELLSMIENCPKGAEPLVARIVHLLTERNVPSKELVEKVRNLHRQRNTDVRSLLPIMVGLHHEELLELIPKFVMNATNSKSVPLFYRKLLFGKHIENREYLMDPKELLIQLHHCQPANIREQGHLLQNIDQLIVDSEKQYHLSKEKIASAIEELLNEKELPKFLYHTLQKIIDNLPALRSFLTIVLQSAVQKHPEDQELNDLSTKAAERARNLPAHPTLAY
jgi:symplekin